MSKAALAPRTALQAYSLLVTRLLTVHCPLPNQRSLRIVCLLQIWAVPFQKLLKICLFLKAFQLKHSHAPLTFTSLPFSGSEAMLFVSYTVPVAGNTL